MIMTGSTRIYGIVGDPVAHSLSPAMHNAAFAALGLDAVYVSFRVQAANLQAAVFGLRALGVLGWNVTVPHKSAIIPLLDEIEPGALRMGAVNTVVSFEGKWIGKNTDAPGLLRALQEDHVELHEKHIVVLGAGGAARAALVALDEGRAKHITVLARRLEQAQSLVKQLQPTMACATLEFGELQKGSARAFEKADAVLQCSSATLASSPDAAAFARALPWQELKKSAVVVDLVYKPRKTTVLNAAAAQGLRTIDGLGMLLFQGALAFEHWTGQPAPIDVVRKALELALRDSA